MPKMPLSAHNRFVELSQQAQAAQPAEETPYEV
jgi:hypothetical protein